MKLVEENDSGKVEADPLNQNDMSDKCTKINRSENCKTNPSPGVDELAVYPTPDSSPSKEEDSDQSQTMWLQSRGQDNLAAQSAVTKEHSQSEQQLAAKVAVVLLGCEEANIVSAVVKHDLPECNSECSPEKVSKTEDPETSPNKEVSAKKCQTQLDFSPRKSNQHRICHANSSEIPLSEDANSNTGVEAKSGRSDNVKDTTVLSQLSPAKQSSPAKTETSHNAAKVSSPPKGQKDAMRKRGRKRGRKKKKEPVQTNTITDYFPVRRSGRQTRSQIEKETEEHILELIKCNCEDGMEVKDFAGKGRGVVATKPFDKGDFVVEYAGELMNIDTATLREAKYERSSNVGCYMYFFCHKNKQYCVDATAESGHLGRLINHSRKGNCRTRVVMMDGEPRLILVAARSIRLGEELSYDYGDRSKASLEAHPWLKL